MKNLIEKYNTPVPRYTSYPTVPHWNTDGFSTDGYLGRVTEAVSLGAAKKGIALYIHLPYCESLCTYCGCNTRITVNHAVEGPYIDAVIAEWKLYLNHIAKTAPEAGPLVIREIHLGGGTPTFFAAAQLERMVTGILEGCRVSADASFSFEAHPANTTRLHLETLHRIGFDRLSLGVQDFDPVVQKAINRKQTPQDVMRVTREAREIGYRSVNFDLVYGLPFQTAEGFDKTLNEVMQMRPDRIALYSYAHVPWKHPGQRAYGEKDLPEASAKSELFISGRDAFISAGYTGIGLDHFALPGDSLTAAYQEGTMHRNFMGYTDLKTDLLIGLGVSAISDAGTAYAQNAKSVEGYLKMIAYGVLPTVKGHLSDSEEIFIGRHVLSLMCRHKTDWSNASSTEQTYMAHCLPALKNLAKDGLIDPLKKGQKCIIVTEKGKMLIRNISAVIDKYYKPIEQKRQFAAAF